MVLLVIGISVMLACAIAAFRSLRKWIKFSEEVRKSNQE